MTKKTEDMFECMHEHYNKYDRNEEKKDSEHWEKKSKKDLGV